MAKKPKSVVCSDIYGKKVKAPAGELYFRPSVYGVAIKNNKVLLVPQWDGYDFPGGGIKLGETLDEAIKREVWEETGLKVKRGPVIACESDFFTMPYTNENTHSIVIYYLCEVTGGKITARNFDEHEKKYAKKAVWMEINDIGKLKFYNSVNSIKIISDALRTCGNRKDFAK